MKIADRLKKLEAECAVTRRSIRLMMVSMVVVLIIAGTTGYAALQAHQEYQRVSAVAEYGLLLAQQHEAIMVGWENNVLKLAEATQEMGSQLQEFFAGVDEQLALMQNTTLVDVGAE